MKNIKMRKHKVLAIFLMIIMIAASLPVGVIHSVSSRKDNIEKEFYAKDGIYKVLENTLYDAEKFSAEIGQASITPQTNELRAAMAAGDKARMAKANKELHTAFDTAYYAETQKKDSLTEYKTRMDNYSSQITFSKYNKDVILYNEIISKFPASLFTWFTPSEQFV